MELPRFVSRHASKIDPGFGMDPGKADAVLGSEANREIWKSNNAGLSYQDTRHRQLPGCQDGDAPDSLYDLRRLRNLSNYM